MHTMNRETESRRIRLSETKPSWEDQGGLEVAAGKLEVMEKFFTPLPHSADRRLAKDGRKERLSWNGVQDRYNVQSFSSSTPSSSSSQWSSESNFERQAGISRYHSHAPHSRSCNDLSVARASKNDYEKRDFLDLKAIERDNKDKYAAENNRARSVKPKGDSGRVKHLEPNDHLGREEKRNLKDGGRLTRSMETLAHKETGKKPGKDRTKVIEQKKRFSRFLDEITIQVLSPSNLNSLGVKEGHVSGAREPWKSSSTDSSGSRGKTSQHNAVGERQEARKKGKGKLEASSRQKGVEIPRPRRELSTSPDSASSKAWSRGEVDPRPGPPGMNSAPRKSKVPDLHKGLQGKEAKSRHRYEQMGRDHNEDCIAGDGTIQGQDSYVDKSQNCGFSNDQTSQVPIIPPPTWWRDISENKDNVSHTRKRSKEIFPGAESTSRQQENNFSSSQESLEADRDSLNKKITELLDHLARAQSTICALEKLNVSSLLQNLPPDMLESMKPTPASLDVRSKLESGQDPGAPNDNSGDNLCQNINVIDSKCTISVSMAEASTGPRPTAFTPWSPKRQRSFPALHTFYTSTESECSLDDVLPTCKLLCPRFPNLGESFSDDRRDAGSSDTAETRAEKKTSLTSKSSLPFQNLLPTHRLPHRKHNVRPSSSESSGDDLQLSCSQMPSGEVALDYLSAQKILDTLLGLTSSSERFSPTQMKNIAEITMSSLPTIIHSTHPDLPRPNSHQAFYPLANEEISNDSEKCSSKSDITSVYQPKDDSGPRVHPLDYTIPPLPVKRSLLPKGLGNNFSNTCTGEEIGYRPVGHHGGLGCHKSESPRPPGFTYSQVPGSDLNTRSVPCSILNPSVKGPFARDWESQDVSRTQKPDGSLERKPRKERTVHFQTLNSEGQTREGQLTLKSKFVATTSGNQELDSTLL